MTIDMLPSRMSRLANLATDYLNHPNNGGHSPMDVHLNSENHGDCIEKLTQIISKNIDQRSSSTMPTISSSTETIKHKKRRALPLQNRKPTTPTIRTLSPEAEDEDSINRPVKKKRKVNPTSSLDHKNKKKSISKPKISTSSSSPSAAKPKSKSKKSERPKDMPRHPLTAYNFFFSAEREKILKSRSSAASLLEDSVSTNNDSDNNSSSESDDDMSEYNLTKEEMKNRLLEHLERRREQKGKRRPHRKTHGVISFKDLAIVIGKRWRELPTKKLAYYHELAEMDKSNYREAMVEYKRKKCGLGKDEDENTTEPSSPR